MVLLVFGVLLEGDESLCSSFTKLASNADSSVLLPTVMLELTELAVTGAALGAGVTELLASRTN